VLDQVWSAVKLSRSRLKEFEPSDAIALGGDEGLMRVKGGIEVRLSCHSFCFLEKERVAGMMVLQMRRISIFEHLSPRTMTLISGGPQQSAGALGSCKEQSRMLECTGSGQQSFYVVPPPSSALFWVDREVFPL